MKHAPITVWRRIVTRLCVKYRLLADQWRHLYRRHEARIDFKHIVLWGKPEDIVNIIARDRSWHRLSPAWRRQLVRVEAKM